MKANFWQALVVYARSCWIMMDICSRAVWKSLTGSITREWVDYTAHQWAKRLCNAAKINIKVINPHNVDFNSERAQVVMCNHSSHYDIPLSFAAVPGSLRMLAKKELAKVPFMGQGMQASEFPFVDRNDRRQAIKDMKAAQVLMESGIILWIAPEGTRTKTGKLGPLKKGGFIAAKQTNALIIPLGIRGSAKVMPTKSFSVSLNQNVEIHIGKPIDSAEFSRDELILKVETALKQLSGETEAKT